MSKQEELESINIFLPINEKLLNKQEESEIQSKSQSRVKFKKTLQEIVDRKQGAQTPAAKKVSTILCERIGFIIIIIDGLGMVRTISSKNYNAAKSIIEGSIIQHFVKFVHIDRCRKTGNFAYS